MKNLTTIFHGALGSMLALAFVLSASHLASAQTAPSGATPVFYTQTGAPVNQGGTAIPAGSYYNQQGQQVYYYGNGTYFNNATGQYGGTAFPANTSAPGVPNSTVTAVGNGNGTTPVFYQNGTAVNPGGTAVPAGNYTDAQGQQVYYYGNGTYYNSATGQYGGQAFGTNPGSLAVNTVGPTVIAVTASGTPLAPNTGAGGGALYTILSMMAALGVAGTGAMYLFRKPALK